jgi:hypothetical protein
LRVEGVATVRTRERHAEDRVVAFDVDVRHGRTE